MSQSSSSLACNSRLRSAIRRHHPPQRAVLSQICCFRERKMVMFQILLSESVLNSKSGLTICRLIFFLHFPNLCLSGQVKIFSSSLTPSHQDFLACSFFLVTSTSIVVLWVSICYVAHVQQTNWFQFKQSCWVLYFLPLFVNSHTCLIILISVHSSLP